MGDHDCGRIDPFLMVEPIGAEIDHHARMTEPHQQGAMAVRMAMEAQPLDRVFDQCLERLLGIGMDKFSGGRGDQRDRDWLLSAGVLD